MLYYEVKNMYYLQNTFLLSILLFIFVTSTISVKLSPHIREKGSASNNVTVNAVNSSNLQDDRTHKVSSDSLKSKDNISSSLTQVLSEGGIVLSTTRRHNGRESVLENPAPKKLTNESVGQNKSSLIDSENVKLVHAESVISALDIAPQQDDEKPSVPKKGVSFRELDTKSNSSSPNVINETKLNTISNQTGTSDTSVNKKMLNITSNHTTPTNSTVKHKKPIVTESDSDFIDVSKSKDEISKETIISIDQIDPLLVDKKSQRSDYIVPIVAVILSVPLVAILTSILYKRGTDWWQHRNYKRMDFLIEGMYHN